jgi:uncharacterized protein (TIGR02246 family)
LIRELIGKWMRASAAGDLDGVLGLLADDVVFLVPGRPPMRGKKAFAEAFNSWKPKFRVDAKADIQEIQVTDNMAYCWNHLRVTMVPLEGGLAKTRSGYTLSILRRSPEGEWLMMRDANLLTVQP